MPIRIAITLSLIISTNQFTIRSSTILSSLFLPAIAMLVALIQSTNSSSNFKYAYWKRGFTNHISKKMVADIPKKIMNPLRLIANNVILPPTIIGAFTLRPVPCSNKERPARALPQTREIKIHCFMLQPTASHLFSSLYQT